MINKCQKEVIRVLMTLEPQDKHEDKCPARKNPKTCTCYLFHNAEMRAAALDEAGLLCDPKNETLQCDPKEMDIMR